uniref:Serine/threonine-protein kinase 1 n=1 Tax=Syphacia muris TaxID=451379 RepID=A0A158R4N7_9BILA
MKKSFKEICGSADQNANVCKRSSGSSLKANDGYVYLESTEFSKEFMVETVRKTVTTEEFLEASSNAVISNGCDLQLPSVSGDIPASELALKVDHTSPPSTPRSFEEYARKRLSDYSFMILESFCEKEVFCNNCYKMQVEVEKVIDKFPALLKVPSGGNADCTSVQRLEEVIAAANNQVESVLKRRDELQLQLNKTKDNLAAAERRLDELAAENKSLRGEISDFETNNIARSKYDKAKAVLFEKEIQLNKQMDEIVILENQLATLKQEKAATNVRMECILRERDELQSQLNKTKRSLAAVEKEKKFVQRDFKFCMEKKHQEIDRQKDLEIAYLKDENRRLSKACDDADEEISQLRKNLFQAKQKLVKIKGQKVIETEIFYMFGLSVKQLRHCYQYGNQLKKLGDSFLDNYDVVGYIGAGACGSVYKAVRKCDQKLVAFKDLSLPYCTMDEWMIGPYPYEVYALEKLVGVPGVIQYLDYYVEDVKVNAKLLLVMEFLEHSSNLKELLEPCSPLPEAFVRFIFKQITEAIMHCVERKIYHLDLKADNMIINFETGEIKIIDFGVIAMCGDYDMKRKKFHDYIYGLPPPEWKKHVKPSKLMSWVLGRQLYTLLTNSTALDTYYIDVPEVFEYPDHVSLGARKLVEKCMKLDMDDRPSFKEILDDEWLKGVESPPMNICNFSDEIKKFVTDHWNVRVSGGQKDHNIMQKKGKIQSISKPLENVFEGSVGGIVFNSTYSESWGEC